ncbi:mannose/glucose-specific lectin-like [Silene latifolia]|uniref:mannose/glucose-specific lectin-like n=1 Tax=Silene latifolia TaxID=37657 RepID=UPI003D77183D
MAENSVVFSNKTTKVLHLKEQHFWSGSVSAAPGRISPGSTSQGKQKATANGTLKFATVYVDNEAEVDTTRKFIAAFDITPPREFGPFGSSSPKTFSITFGADETVKEVFVRHGFIVDAIGFVIADKTGATHTKTFGGDKGVKDTITLQPGREYITQITGTYGKFAHSDSDAVVATLFINTNIKQYGPYGRGELVQNPRNFASAVGNVIGFFGRNSNYLESIGVSQSNNANSKAYAESGPFGPVDWNVVEVKLGLKSGPSDVYVDHILGGKVEATVTTTSDATVVISDS